MQITVVTRHGNLSDPTRERVVAKAEKLKKYFERLSSIEIIVDLEVPDNPRVDIKVSAEHKHDFVAHEQAGDLWPSVDAAVQKLEQQLRKYKEKVQDRNRNHEVRRQDAFIEGESEAS